MSTTIPPPVSPDEIDPALMDNPLLPPVGELTATETNQQNQPELILTDEELRDALLSILNIIDKEEAPSRELLVRQWKYYSLLWEGIQPIFWNAMDKEWQLIDKVMRLPNNIVIDPMTFNKSINILRAYGESIAGAVTPGLPKVNYYPDNADQIDDVKTSKAYSKTERIIAEHNSMELGLLKAAMTLWQFGFVAAHNHSHESEAYGTHTKPIRSDVSYTNTAKSCPNCGSSLSSSRVLTEDYVAPEVEAPLAKDTQTDPTTGFDVVGDSILDENLEPCETCNAPVNPISNVTQETSNEVTGFEQIPRSRQVIDIYGPLEVKIPVFAKSKGEVIWVILEEEYHYSQLRHKYPDYYEKIKGGEGGAANSYERWARSNYEVTGETLENLTSLQRVWFKPDAFCILGDKELSDKLYEMYPEGIYFAVINDEIPEVKGENLDECWTFSENPGDRRLLAIPPAKNAVPIQELTNDVMSLEVKCFKHSIGTTFINPEVFSFENYRKTRKEPGQVFPMAMSANGTKLDDNIAELRTSVLPKEAKDLDDKLERLGQFVTGAFPSVFGGEATGSKTAFEYKESKNNALQRLSIIWKVISWFYANIMNKAIRSFIDNMADDEFYTTKQGNSFINVWIKKAETQGKIGRVSPEVTEQFPTSWAQKRSTLMDLINMKDQMITSVIFHPENVGLLAQLIGIDELFVPGDNDRNKQLEEIQALITSEPTPDPSGALDPNTGQPQMISSVPIDPDIDDSNIHAEVMKAFACSDVGLYIKESNPAGWQNFMLHLQAHNAIVQQQQVQQDEAERKKTAKAPAESMNYKDTPEDIKRQIEAQEGLIPSQLPPVAPPVSSSNKPPQGAVNG